MKTQVEVFVDDKYFWSDGESLGKCEMKGCGDTAYFYNEDGQLRCPECLVMFIDEGDED